MKISERILADTQIPDKTDGLKTALDTLEVINEGAQEQAEHCPDCKKARELIDLLIDTCPESRPIITAFAHEAVKH